MEIESKEKVLQNKFLSREDLYKFQEGPERQRLGTMRNKGLKQEFLPKASSNILSGGHREATGLPGSSSEAAGTGGG